MSEQNSNLPKRALILAAGRGKRLRPYTDTIPKPLLRVNGRPTLDIILDSLQMAEVTDVAFVVHHLAEQIRDFVDDGSQWGMKATFFDQPDMKGTGHAVQTAVSFLTEPTFILAADYILPQPFLLDLKNKYRQSGTDMAVSLKRLSDEEMKSRSSVRFNNLGFISEIVEKPPIGTAPSKMGASLIFIVPPQIRKFLTHLQLSSRHEYEIQDAINGMLKAGFTLCGLDQGAPPEWRKE